MASLINKCREYFRSHIYGELEHCIDLFCNSISLYSTRDGYYYGKDGVKTYLQKLPPIVDYCDPVQTSEYDFVVYGKSIDIMQRETEVNIQFNPDGLIRNITIF